MTKTTRVQKVKTDRYAQSTFDFFERARSLADQRELENALLEVMAGFGFDTVTIWMMPPPGSPINGIMLNNRPESYVQNYVEKNHVLRDPVVLHMRDNMRPFSWGDVRASRELSRVERSIIDEAREFGALDGLTIPIVTATGSLSVVSPCGRNPDLSPRARSAMEMIAVIGEQALKRAIVAGNRTEIDVSLTNREREIFQYIAWGKTDPEIAEILSISPHTVAKHIENAKQKLGAVRRFPAVILALRRGDISL
jgi:DNA-binding CsgD family transcriptional regulator